MSAEKSLPKGWKWTKLDDVLNYEQPTQYIVQSTNYKDEYETPVLTAGKTFILGYTNETENIFPKDILPVIIFDDFTTANKFVDFQFKVKSSAMKILRIKDANEADIKYIYFAMQNIILDATTHKRYWIAEYSQIEIPLPPLPEQKRIVAKIEKQLAAVEQCRLAAEQQCAEINLMPAAILRKTLSH